MYPLRPQRLEEALASEQVRRAGAEKHADAAAVHRAVHEARILNGFGCGGQSDAIRT